MLLNARYDQDVTVVALETELVGARLNIPHFVADTRKVGTRLALRLSLIAGDMIAIVAAFGLIAAFRMGDATQAIAQLLTLMVVTLPIYTGIAFNSRAFDLEVISQFRISVQRSLMAFVFTVSAVSLMAFFLKAGGDFSRLVFGFGAALAVPAIVMMRMTVTAVALRTIGSNPYVELIIRDGVPIDMDHDATVLDAAVYGLHPSVKDPANIQRLGKCVRGADRVIVACPPERRTKWAFVLKALDINAEIYVPELDDMGAVAMGRVCGGSTLVISTGPLPMRHQFVKRAFDVLVVLGALPFAAIPMILTAIAIKLESPGPVLFKQVRIGLGNRPFHILKFRSMHMEQSDLHGHRSAGREDDRITRVGAFIRKTSIDELPQILNVLKGDMSIVGPRPHAVGSRAENMLFWDIDDRYWHRHAVKPGLTGLAQVRGFRGATELREDLSNRLQSDLEYRANWSLLRDISILFATFRVLVHRNAF